MTQRVAVRAPAKVNLFLRVLGRRADGYHDLRTLFQSIDVFDDVSVELGGTEIELEIDGPDLGPVSENLAYRAASTYRAAAGLEDGVRIALRKRIPAGAGLGGGSSDAAAVLSCLSALTGDADRERLHVLGASLGSDVPFFLGSSTLALGTGRGDVLEALPSLPEAHLVVAFVPVHVSTRAAYAALAEQREGGGSPPIVARQTSLQNWADVRSVAFNDFERVVATFQSEIMRALTALKEAGAGFALLSGSGGASFGLFDDRDQAVGVAADLSEELGWRCVAAQTLSKRPVPSPV